MKAIRPDGVRLTLVCLIAVLMIAVAPTRLAAQADPGPRPAGITNAGFCPVNFAPDKFTEFCIDTNQPASTHAPTADGAGNVLAVPGQLGTFWFQALTVFETFATVFSTSPTTANTIVGLGPSFNAEHCFECHSQPTVGGASGGIIKIGTTTFTSTINPFAETITPFVHNPEIDSASHDGATNSLPCFLTAAGCGGHSFINGPVVETRFVKAVPADPTNHSDAVGAGSVAELFVVAGRSDLPVGNTCQIGQQDFGTQVADDNVIFRTPTPTFGLGFVENTPEPTLMNDRTAAATAASNSVNATSFGTIKFDNFNRSGNDGTITRFGWKAQNKSLLMFSGEAANVEMGVTNELFPNEKTFGGVSTNLNCVNFNNYPEDQILNTEQKVVPPTKGDPSQISSDIQNFAVFMRLNGAPSQCDFKSAAGVCNAFTNPPKEGQCLFGQRNINPVLTCPTSIAPLDSLGVGCVLCHTDQLTTGPSLAGSLNNATFEPFSDFAIHDMGASDSDGVTQGLAGPQFFRTAPLWGAGQRFFFFHDGRFTDLLSAIEGHCQPSSTGAASTSEACGVIANFNKLTPAQQQDVLDFLRSL
jgi:hypothetical protein